MLMPKTWNQTGLEGGLCGLQIRKSFSFSSLENAVPILADAVPMSVSSELQKSPEAADARWKPCHE